MHHIGSLNNSVETVGDVLKAYTEYVLPIPLLYMCYDVMWFDMIQYAVLWCCQGHVCMLHIAIISVADVFSTLSLI